MRQAAVDYYLAHGKSLARTMRRMGYPFVSGSPPLSPIISLRQAQGAVLDTLCFSAICAAGPVLASSSAMTCTFFSMGAESRFGFGSRRFRCPGAGSSIQLQSVMRLFG
jgi:hypothetical protein